MVDALKFRLLFQRATFLQTKLFEDIPNQADKVFPQAKLTQLNRELHPQLSAFNYGAIRKLCYPGLIFLVYAVAETLQTQERILRKKTQLSQVYSGYDRSRPV